MNSTSERFAARALTAYPAYKDSGVEWLGEVPAHWEVRPLRTLVECAFSGIDKAIRSQEKEVSFVGTETAYRTSFIRSTTRLIRVTASLSEIEHFQLIKGDVLITKDSVVPTRIAVPALVQEELTGITVCGYHLGLLRTRPGLESSYLFWLLRSKCYADYFIAEARGTTIIGLPFRAVASAPIPGPPLTEQTAIVRFLDHVDRRIRRYIRVKQKLIALLEEQKQVLVHQAVTGRIDVRTGRPYPAYRESGLEWLGIIPAHWRVVPLKRAFVSMDYGISDTGTDEGTIPVLTMGDIDRNGTVTVREHGGVTSVASQLLLRDKDLLFNRTNGSAELVGKVGLFRAPGRAVTFASYLVRMRAHRGNKPEFLNSLLNDAKFLGSARREAIATLQLNLNPTRYGRLQIPLPPTDEQEAVVGFLDKRASSVDSAIARTNHEIAFLREYRTRSIVDVVTGKLDVRDAATGLPDLDLLTAEDDPDDGFIRHGPSAASADRDEGGLVPAVVDAKRSDVAAGTNG